MTDTECLTALSDRMRSGATLTAAEFDEYLDLTEPVGGAAGLPVQRG
jgi:hypothetical protein